MIPNRISGKRALITGATSGIGRACARSFADAGVHLILAGRRIDRLLTLKQELIRRYRNLEVEVHSFDIQKLDQVQHFVEELGTLKVDILINNAGLAAGLDPIDKADLKDWEQMIDTNVKGLLYVTRAFAQHFRARNAGHIINVGSIAGYEAYAGGSVYAATKHAVKAITRATKHDFLGTKVRVSEVSPGLVETEFSQVRFKGDEQRAQAVYRGIEPLTAEDVAELIYFVANCKDHVNILDSIILPVAQAAATAVARDE